MSDSAGINLPRAMVPAAVVGPDGAEDAPHLGGHHSLSGTRQTVGGLLGAAHGIVATNIASFDLESAKSKVQALEQFMQWLKEYAFKRLGNGDFVAYSTVTGDGEDSSKPWLTAHAAEKVAETCGISYGMLGEPVEESGKDDQGDWYLRRVRLWVQLGTRYVESMGEATSRDKLFSHGGTLTASQVERNRLTQKALTRAVQSGVGRILGLRGMDWEQVQALCGGSIDLGKVKAAKMRKGAQGGGRSAADGQAKATGAQVRAVYARWCDVMGLSSERGDAWEQNKYRWGVFCCGACEFAAPKKWANYTGAELAKLNQAVEDLKHDPSRRS